MPNKSFGFYTSGEEFAIESGDELIVEIGKTFVACILTRENKKAIVAFELFAFTASEAENFASVFEAVKASSRLLGSYDGSTQVYVNNELALLVPIFKFNKEIASDYLNVVFGDDFSSKVHFEHLPIEPGMMNVFRLHEEIYNVLNTQLPRAIFKHTWSNVVKTLTANAFSYNNAFISVQFYTTYIIVAVYKNGALQLIQSFVYDTPTDVLYYLLNICQQFGFYAENLQLQVSGMIDPEFKLYRELITHFRTLTVVNVEAPPLLPQVNEHPLHYFTPFFNLAR